MSSSFLHGHETWQGFEPRVPAAHGGVVFQGDATFGCARGVGVEREVGDGRLLAAQVRRALDTWAALNRRDEVDALENERDYIDDKRETNKQTRIIKRLTDNLIRMVERQPGDLTQAQALSRLRLDRYQVTHDEIMSAVMATDRVEIRDKRLHLRHKT